MKITAAGFRKFVTMYFCLIFYLYSFLNASIRGITCGILGLLLGFYYFVFYRKGLSGMHNINMLLKFFWVLIIILSFNNNYELKNGNYGRLIYFIVPIIFFLIINDGIEWISTFVEISRFFTGCSVIGTFIVKLVPSIYNEYIVPFFPLADEATAELNDTIGRSYNSGISLTAGINAAYLSVGIGVYLYSYLSTEDRKSKMKYLLWTTLGIIALFLTDKRGPILFALCAITIVWYENLAHKTKFVAAIFISILAIVMILGTIGIVDGNTIGKYWNKDSSSGRTLLYTMAIKLFIQKPILGNGWMSYQYLSGIKARGTYIMTHNVFLQLLSETGIVGFVIVVIGFCINLAVILKAVNLAKKIKGIDNHAYYWSLLGLYGESYFLMTCLTGNSLYDNVFLYFYSFSSAIGLSVVNHVCAKSYE